MTAGRLPRRLVVGATSAALLAGAVGFLPLLGSASAAMTAPVAGCSTLADPKGDAVVSPLVGGPGYAESELDLTGLVLGTDETTLRAVLRVDALGTSPDTAPGDAFFVYFTYNKHAFVLTNVRFDPDSIGTPLDVAATATAGTPAQRSPRLKMTVDGTYVPSGIKVAYDLKASTVTFDVPRADVAKAGGGPFADGEPLTGVYGRDLWATPTGGGLYVDSTASDNATATGPKDVWTVGDNACFGGGTPAPSATPTAAPTPSATPTPSAPPAGTLFEQPRKGCVQYKDATGDADPTTTGQFNEGSLDVTQVNLKSPAGALQVFVGLVNPSEALFDTWTGRIYTVTMTVGGKSVVLTATGDGAATATVGGAANSDIKATAKADAKAKSLVLTIPLDGLSKATATAIAAGTPITTTTVDTKANSPLGARAADNAAGKTDVEKTYAYGDNSCFLPPAGIVTLEADPKGQYGDTTELFATLTDADESPVAGATVTAVLTGGRAVSATTDEDGVAGIVVPLSVVAGAKTLTAAFAGSGEVGAATASVPFTVVAEKTVLKAVGVKGGAKATVLDDDKHVVAGKPVTFLIGKTKKVVKTNSKGIAVVTGLARGTAVKVSFAPVKGYYLGTPTSTVKAL